MGNSLKQTHELRIIEAVNYGRGWSMRNRPQVREHEYVKFLVKCSIHAFQVGDYEIYNKLIKEIDLIDNPTIEIGIGG